MITSARFTNFKLLRDVEIPLGRLNVIVGANGAGKSSVLEALHYLLQLGVEHSDRDGLAGGRAAHLFRGPKDPDHLISHPDQNHFMLSVKGDGLEEYSLVCERSQGPERYSFKMRFHSASARARADHDFNKPQPNTVTEAFFRAVASSRVGSVVRTRLDAARLAEDHYSEERAPLIAFDGEGLASVLQELIGARDGRFEAIEHELAKVVPSLRRIRSTRARIVRREKIRISIDGQESWSEQEREYTGSGIEIEWGKVGWIPASHMSEGTLLALGIITILHHRPPSMVLLDDIDKALHPTAQCEMMTFLKGVVQAHTDVQIIATSHSPYVVDQLDPESVLVAATVDERMARVRRLSDNPKWKKQRDYLQPGEFWSAVGESWVAEKKESWPAEKKE